MIDLKILNSKDCQQCRRCCKFEPEELVDAPTFTQEQKERALGEFTEENLRFQQRGKLWQVVLRKLPDGEKYICPLYDENTAKCRVYDYKIFDCRTWPYYIMRKDGKVVITLSPDCPVVLAKDMEMVVRFAKNNIGPNMVETARKNPDLITEYHGNAIVLYEIDDF